MSYKTKILPLVSRQIVAWKLSDFLWTEVLLRLHQTLPANPHALLHRTTGPFDGLAYRFSLVDPENRFCEHGFLFHVLYDANEETLWVVAAMHLRVIGA